MRIVYCDPGLSFSHHQELLPGISVPVYRARFIAAPMVKGVHTFGGKALLLVGGQPQFAESASTLSHRKCLCAGVSVSFALEPPGLW